MTFVPFTYRGGYRSTEWSLIPLPLSNGCTWQPDLPEGSSLAPRSLFEQPPEMGWTDMEGVVRTMIAVIVAGVLLE